MFIVQRHLQKLHELLKDHDASLSIRNRLPKRSIPAMLVNVNYEEGCMFTPRQQEIIQAAMRIVTEQGTQKLTIRNVATAIGVTEPAVYRHFANKHELLASLLQSLQESILPIFRDMPVTEDSLEKILRDLLLSLFSHVEANPGFAMFVFTEEAFHADMELRPLLVEMLAKITKSIQRLFHQLQASGKCRGDMAPAHMATIFLGTIRLMITRWHLQGKDHSLTESSSAMASSMTLLFR
ncbi:MAG: TetR/AcrR family transcriptional regulator [Sphaerochaetaceae bacterium]|nr:TetR/AcrR family transcriptional regulator [Sphaerochaetaceae bacterium]